jgi:subtilisin family serine protease
MRPILLALLLSALPSAHAASERQRYIVELHSAPTLAFTGDAQTKATRPDVGERFDADAIAVRAYLARLDAEQAAALAEAGKVLGRRIDAVHRYRHVLNGMALDLSPTEAERVSRLPGVSRIERETVEHLHTDAGPSWIGAGEAWSGVPGANATRGEGIVVGIIDTGIAAFHPAFAAVDQSGYRHQNPRGRRFGLCNSSAAARCNDKLIGIHDFTNEGARDGNDINGHGTHVAGTAVGNLRTTTIQGQTTTLDLTLSGVAPRANLISYKGCTNEGENGSCPGSATTAALDQAVADGVDVVNYSIGGGAVDPWPALTGGASASMRAMANLTRAGIAISVSAGNSGPGAATISSPANSPWVLAIAAATSDRRLANVLTELSGQNVAPPVNHFVGAGLAGGVGPVRIVLGADFGSALCSQGSSLDSPPTGASTPWPTPVFSGQIVVCDRGVQARVAKGFNVQRAGGGGMVLVNTASDGESTVSDDHFLPATHLGFSDGEVLKQWVRANPGGAIGRLTGVQALRDPAFGDVLASFSSRGPDPNATGVLRPSLTAPGVNVLAPAHNSSGESSKSGTSMSSPHVAGALALLRSQRGGESPGTLYSALELTALAGVRLQDGTSSAGILDAGAGRLRIDRALAAGLVMPIAMSDYDRENPRAGGDPARLNLPTLHRENCRGRCNFTRTFRAWRGASYSVIDTSSGGMRITAQPASFTLSAGQSQTVVFEVDVSAPTVLGRTATGEVTLRADDPTIPDSRLRALVRSVAGNLPSRVEINAQADRGRHTLPIDGLVALPALGYRLHGPVPVRREDPQLNEDPSPDDAFDSDAGTATFLVTLSAPGVVRADVVGSSAPDIDLYIGRDSNGNGRADEAELLCQSRGPVSVERCQLERQPAGSYWIRVQSYDGSTFGDSVHLEFAALATNEANPRGHAQGPTSAAENASITIDAFYDLAGLPIGSRAWAWLELRAGRTAETGFALIPFDFLRTGATAPTQRVLADGVSSAFVLPAASQHDRLVIDVPSDASRLTVRMTGSIGNAGLYLARAPGQAITPDFPPAPPLAEAVAVSDGPDSNETLVLDAPSLSPGRWYVVARNPGSSLLPLAITATLETAPQGAFAYEAWFNPARNGHGLFFSRAGDAAQMVWYTYDEAGRPTWYLAFPDALTAGRGQVRADLFRYHWLDGGADGVRVGEVVLSRQQDRLVLGWEIDGVSGAERMELLASSACVGAGNTSFDPTGLWFEPARSGYGANFFTRPDTDFVVYYLYDGAGKPRWVLGQNPAFGNPLTLYQYAGFCPGCAAGPVTRTAVGAASRVFDASGATSLGGRWTFSADFAAPLSGRFEAVDTPVALLTGRKSCP